MTKVNGDNDPLTELDYGMAGSLDSGLEKVLGNHLILAGPLSDGYLKEIGKAMYEKLTRGHLTGLVPPFTTFIPWQVFRYLSALVVGYGAHMKLPTGKRKRPDKMIIWVESDEGAKKIWHNKRFDGAFYLTKRMFRKKLNPESKKPESVYDGYSKVVVSKYTPIRMEYSYKSQKLKTSFYIQRYNSDGFSIDTALQDLINTGINWRHLEVEE